MKESDKPERRSPVRRFAVIAIPSTIVIVAVMVLFLMNAPNGKLLSSLNGTVSAQAAIDQSTVQIQKGSVVKTLVINGDLRAVNSQVISASTSDEAKITYLPPEGSIIHPGERLLELDSSTAQNKIADMEEKIVAAENEIVKAEASNESSIQDMAVQLSQLWLPYEQAKIKARIPEGVEGRRLYQEKQFDMAKAKADYENQIAKMAQKKKEQAADLRVKVIEKEKLVIQLNQAKGDLTGMTIVAPSEGMVIYGDHWNERRKIQIGDIVWSGFPIVTLPDLKQMEVLAKVNEVDGPKLSIGQKAKIVLDSYQKVEITGTVKDISQTAVKANYMGKSRIFNVVISLDKTLTDIMKPGMSAQVAVTVSEIPSQLLVPRSAINFEGGTPQVVRLEAENQRRSIAVTVLGGDAFNYAVADNGALKEGDRIVKSQAIN